MKRFASFAAATALAGSLVGAASTARADSALYLVPISDLNATYAPGSEVQFAAVADIGISNFSALAISTSLAYSAAQFGAEDPSAKVDETPDPRRPHQAFWNLNIGCYNNLYQTVNGEPMYAIQSVVGHTTQFDAARDALTFPAGTRTVGTFTFPIASTIQDSTATIYMATPYGFSISADTTDGDYYTGVGPTLSLRGVDSLHRSVSDPLSFPNSNGKYSALTFKIGNSLSSKGQIADTPEPGATALFAAALVSGAILLRRRKTLAPRI